MSRLLLTGCDLFDGDELRENTAVLVDNGIIAAVMDAQATAPGDAKVIKLDGLLLAPGFIDLQVNGGGGILFNDAPTVATLRTMVAAHRRFGTTACLPTLISDSAAVMGAAIDAVRDAMAQGVPGIAGIHIEGPHLNPLRRGVHDTAHLRELDADAYPLLCSLAEGRTLVTLAPECVDHAIIRQLREAGIVVCAGHSAATYEETRLAIDAGLRGFTHLFNAMPPMESRAPGIVGAALQDPDTFVGIIADGHHVHPAMLGIAIHAKAWGKTVLVTDAMPTVGSDRQQFLLYGETIAVKEGRCVTAEGILAGSNIGMIDAVKYIADQGIVDVFEALRMASVYPAAALGLDDSLGYVKAGYRANLVALDENLEVACNLIDGQMEAYR
ncbi:MAG: N-acetylglucosamine-6-phosphate deacetylase [Gammaproteobacteria bacterium]|nr:N-acetylglucosamine-6-phosphate deacetylase [Gammaproteobacteria bacterium]MDH5619989.1 N-acetylglucosamine-6-phosphate deacetylase [Gammaproteobacteria bacterium]